MFYHINSDGDARKDVPTYDLWFEHEMAFAGDCKGKRSVHTELFKKLEPNDFLFIYHSNVGYVGVVIVLEKWDKKIFEGLERLLYKKEPYEYRIKIKWIQDWRKSPKREDHGLPIPRGRAWQRIDESKYPNAITYICETEEPLSQEIIASLLPEESTEIPSASDYCEALQKVNVSEIEKRMLEAHYQAPQQSLTAFQLAKMLGYSHHGPANNIYGRLGKKIGKQLKWTPARYAELGVTHLALFKKPDDNWRWIMRPQLASALEKLGWVSPSAAALPEEVADNTIFFEGAVRSITVNAYERNSQARKKCVAHHGYKCAACGILLSSVYGEIGQKYIHVHHLRQLSDVGESYEVDPINDLKPVCPNCHAMIHRKNPPYSIEEIANLLRK